MSVDFKTVKIFLKNRSELYSDFKNQIEVAKNTIRESSNDIKKIGDEILDIIRNVGDKNIVPVKDKKISILNKYILNKKYEIFHPEFKNILDDVIEYVVFILDDLILIKMYYFKSGQRRNYDLYDLIVIGDDAQEIISEIKSISSGRSFSSIVNKLRKK